MSPVRIPANDVRNARRLILRAGYYLFLACGVVGLGYSSYVFADAHRYQARQQSVFEESRTQNVSLRLSEQPLMAADGGVIGEMEVPRLGMTLMVVQGDSAKDLRRAVGHLRETVFPGQSGNAVLAGHRDSFFRPLRNIRSGDAITFKTLDAEYEYRVESIAVVRPDDVSSLRPSSEPLLTLITCYPFYYVGASPDRFVVRARLVSPTGDHLGGPAKAH